MHVAIPAAGESPDPSEVLGQYLAGRDTPQEVRAQISVRRNDHIPGAQGISRADGHRLLSGGQIDAAQNFPLPVEDSESLFELP